MFNTSFPIAFLLENYVSLYCPGNIVNPRLCFEPYVPIILRLIGPPTLGGELNGLLLVVSKLSSAPKVC
jgi:hypothetical protein